MTAKIEPGTNEKFSDFLKKICIAVLPGLGKLLALSGAKEWSSLMELQKLHSVSLFKKASHSLSLAVEPDMDIFCIKTWKKKKPQIIHFSAFFHFQKELQDPLTCAHLHHKEPSCEIMSSQK